MSLTAVKSKTYIDETIGKWLDIHFGDTSFNGRAVIGRRKPGFDAPYAWGVRPLTELHSIVDKIDASAQIEYYITANTVSGIHRRKDGLFGLQNIVIDIDDHTMYENPLIVDEFVEAFVWRSKRDLFETGAIPTPNSIVRTGRGVQLWWALVPCYGGKGYDKSLYYHNYIKSILIDQIDSLLDKYGSEEFGNLKVDQGPSMNTVGFFRLPCTYHATTNRYGTLEIVHDARHDQRDFVKALPQMKKPLPVKESKTVEQPPAKTKYIPLLDSDREVIKGFQTVGVRRVIQLIKLRNLRKNKAGSEERNHFNFSVYNALRMAYTHNEAMERVRAFNAGFEIPMTEEELQSSLCSAIARGGYNYKNETLIELLKISAEEQNAIGLLPYSRKRRSKPNASRDEARRTLKEDRDKKIVELVESGVSQAETARILGIGKNTVGRVIKRLRDDAEAKKDEVVVPVKPESNRHHFGSIYGFTVAPCKKAYDNDRDNSTYLPAVDSS